MVLSVLYVTYLVLILVGLFGLTIFVHELGHFLSALSCGMIVDTFSIGFGPAIWKRKRNGITYRIGCIPFGGYVALPQLDPAAMEIVQGKGESGEKKESAEGPDIPWVSPWKKIYVSVSGAVGNILLGIVFACVIYAAPDVLPVDRGAIIGQVASDSAAFAAGLRRADEVISVYDEPVATWYEFAIECHLQSGSSNMVRLVLKSQGQTKVLDVPTAKQESGIYVIEGVGPPETCLVRRTIAGQPAERAGLEKDDLILQFNGRHVIGSDHLIELVGGRGGEETTIVVRRGENDLELLVTPVYNDLNGKVMIGIEFASSFAIRPPWMQHRNPMAQLKYDATQIWRILRALTSRRDGVAGRAAGALGGPLAILHLLWSAISVSILNAIGFIRFLNINLAILNLLPIPVLDGGHVMFSLWEGITRRRVHPRVVNILVNAFAVLIIGAMLWISARDLIRLLPKWFGQGDKAAIEQKLDDD